MRYSDIIDYQANWDRAKYPLLRHGEIMAKNRQQLERQLATQTQLRILGYDEAAGGRLVVHVAAATERAWHRFKRQ